MRTIIAMKTEQPILYKLATYMLGVFLLFACSQISIPIQPVPITLQTVGITAIALLYNYKDAVITYISYITIGSLGAPVFSNYNSGLKTLLGPCLGYFIGFLAAIYIINKIKTKIGMDSFLKIVISCISGTAVIFICGIAWLSTSLGIEAAITVGLLPFIIPGIIKSIILGGIFKLLGIIR